MHIHLDSQPILRRYLTLFYGFTLGLALVLAYIAIDQRLDLTPGTASLTQATMTSTASPTRGSTPAHGGTPTAIPAIPSTPNEKTPSALGVSSEELRGVKVSLWHPWTGAAGTALHAILAEFNRTNRWGISVEPSAYEGFGALDEAVETVMAADAPPGVVVDYGYQARHWDTSNALVDLNPYVNDPVWGLTDDEQADFSPAFWDEDVVTEMNTGQARRLAVPYFRSAYVLFYNQSWASELGYPNPPISPEDFRKQACAAADAVASSDDAPTPGRGGWLLTAQPGELLGWIYAFGGDVTGEGASVYLFNTPETQQALVYLREMQENGCALLDSQVDLRVEFASRGALFVVGSLFDIAEQQRAFGQLGSADEWMVIPFLSEGQPAVDTYGPSIMVTRSTPAEQLAAWLVIEWLVYPPNQAEWVDSLAAYPVRMNTLTYLNEAGMKNPQWAQALELLPFARSEPTLASWGVMRWALQDAMTQLFNPQFTPDQITSLLNNLDSLASEVAPQEP